MKVHLRGDFHFISHDHFTNKDVAILSILLLHWLKLDKWGPVLYTQKLEWRGERAMGSLCLRHTVRISENHARGQCKQPQKDPVMKDNPSQTHNWVLRFQCNYCFYQISFSKGTTMVFDFCFLARIIQGLRRCQSNLKYTCLFFNISIKQLWKIK